MKDPARWAYGEIDEKGERISEIAAYVQRLNDGSWNWYAVGLIAGKFGNEPNVEEAKKAAVAALDRLAESEETL